MNANIMSILCWSNPAKSAVVLLSINFILWVLTRQRPFYVLPMVVLLWYGRQLWRHRIRSEVLVDPPDHEEWMNLSTYDLQQVTKTLIVDIFQQWLALRESNHFLWTVGTCTGWIMLAKIGMEIDFLTILFILSNFAFVVFPALEFLPKTDHQNQTQIQDQSHVHQSYHEQTSTFTTTSSVVGSFLHRRRSNSASPPSPDESPITSPTIQLVGTPQPSSPLYDYYEGIVTRSISAAATSLINNSQAVAAAAVFNIGGMVSSQMEVNEEEEARLRMGPETLSPPISEMPGVDDVEDSDPEDEFLFDARHFDKSSSSTSVSTSFEIIDDDLL